MSLLTGRGRRGLVVILNAFPQISSKLLTEKCVFGGEYEEEQLTKKIRLEYWLYFFLVLFHMHFCEKKNGV